MLPLNGEIDGISRKKVEVYEGDELYDFIRSGSQLALEYDFIKTAGGIYSTHFDYEIGVEVYQFSDSESAYGFFSAVAFEQEKTDQPGTMAVVTKDYTIMWDGNFYAAVYPSKEHEGAAEIIRKIIDYIDKKVPESRKPREIALLRELYPGFKDETLVAGPYGITNILEINAVEGSIPDKMAVLSYPDANLSVLYLYIYKNKENAGEGLRAISEYIDNHSSTAVFDGRENGFQTKSESDMYAAGLRKGRYLLLVMGMDRQRVNEAVFRTFLEEFNP